MPESLEDETLINTRERELLARAERAEGRLHALLASMPQAYLAINRDWQIIFANRQAAIINRQEIDKFVGKNIWAIWADLIDTEVDRQFRRVMETQVPAQFEYFSRNYDAWFELNVQPTEEGLGIHYLDTTQRKRAEKALQQNNLRIRAFTKLNPQLILMADAHGQVNYANQELLDYIGMTLEEARGGGWRAALHPEEELPLLQAWNDAVAPDIDFETEARLRRGSDGSFRWFWLRGVPVRDELNKTLYWLGVCIETHEHKLAVEELKKSQEEADHRRLELETIYRTAPIGLALFDPVEFRYLRLNDRQAEIIGLPAEEILGRKVTEIAQIEGLEEVFQQVAGGRPITNRLLEGELPMQPGIHRYWTVNCTPVYEPDGTVRAITAATLEITTQKRTEIVLIQSEKLAAVGRLASSISHEINNPLESVTNLLYLTAAHEQLPQQVADYLQVAQRELARVSQIATQSLRFHRQAMNPTWTGTADLMNSVLDLYQGRLFNSNIQIHARYTSARQILCFEDDIRQVLNNLIANAIDAMRSGGRLLLRTHNAIDWKTGAKGIRLTVADTGHGMSEEVKRHIFEAFYTTKELNGTGLGLWISHEIVARHQGHLTVRSSDQPRHAGTVFTLFLPEGQHSSASSQ